MKTLKHLFMLSIFCMISIGAGAAVYSGSCGDNAKWSLDTSTGLLSITGSGKMWDNYSDAPWYNYRNDIISLSIGDQITSIGNYAFDDCSGLTSVTIPNSVTSIGESAFDHCSGLTSVTIPNSVTSIGNCAFRDCSGLTSVTIPNSVTSIGWFAFGGCSGLTSVTIPNSVTSIDWGAFSDCSGLTSVTIPNSVTEIGNSAFEGCSGLTSVTIPNSVTEIGYYAFDGCSGLTSVGINIVDWANKNIVATYFSNKSLLYTCNYKKLEGDCTIPDSVTTIGDNALYKCKDITKLIIPNSVTSIGSYAFEDCSGLTSVTIPNSVTSIGDDAFLDCSGLTNVTIGNSVTSIGESAFRDCSGLTSVNITDLDKWAEIEFKDYLANPLFYAHDLYLDGRFVTEAKLTTANKIGSYAFSGCSGLISVTIPNSVTEIGYEAFRRCSNLTSVTISNSVTSIGDYAFCDCSGLTSATIGNSVTTIGTAAFEGCSGLTSVTIPNSVTSIGSYAFYKCSGLTSVTIGNSVTSIGSSAFAFCSGLTSVTIPNSVTSIGDGAFEYCKKIAKIEYYANCQYSTGFSGFSSLKEVIIGDSVTILNTSFSNCKNLTKLTLGKLLQNIRTVIFIGCSSLNEVHSRAETPPYLYPNVFKDVPLAFATLYVPMSAKGAYAEADTWKDFGTIVSDTPDPVMHKIHIEVSDYGKVSYLGNNVTNTSWDGSFEEGESIVLKIIPNDGAKLTKLLVNGMNMTSQVKDNQLTLEGMETDVTVKATFETEMMTLTIATSEGIEKTFDVEYGAQFTFMLSQYADNVEKVVFNDVDVTADVVTEEVAIPLWQLGMYESSDECSIQKYTTPAITASSRLEVTYKLNHPLGDTNLDGTVNVNDITATAEIILLRAKAEMEAEFDE